MNIFKSFDKVIRKIEEYILAWGIIAISLITIFNVISRFIFNYSLVYTYDISKCLIIIITFIGIGYAVRQGRHIRMTAIYDLLNERYRKILIIFISMITALIMLYLCYLSIQYYMDVKETGKLMTALRIPLHWIYIWIPFGFFIAFIEYILAVYMNLIKKDVYLSTEKVDAYETEGECNL